MICLFAQFALAATLVVKPETVPKNAFWGAKEGVDWWLTVEKAYGMTTQRAWRTNGKQALIRIRLRDLVKVVNFSNEGAILSKEQNLIKNINGDGPRTTIDASFPYGKKTFFDDKGRASSVLCESILADNDKGSSGSIKAPKVKYCGEEIEYNPDGSVKSRKQHPDKCLQGCGEFKPFMPPGKYKVHATNVILRDKPSTKGKSLGTLQKGAELQVIEDTHKIETHDFETAPWVKVKYDGKTGYVFGGFLDSLERNDL